MKNQELKDLKEKIKEKLSDKFYYENLGFVGPFGANGGLDCFIKFENWRNQNKTTNPENFLNKFGLPIFDWHNTNELDIRNNIDNSDHEISQALTPEIMSELFDSMRKEYKKQTGKDLQLNESVTKKNSYSYIHIVEQDLAVISTAFGQYVLEGKTDKNIIDLAESALKRQMLNIFMDKIEDDIERESKKREYETMLNDLKVILNS